MTLPTDHELKGMVFSLWHGSLNRELPNILGCMASRMRVQRSKEWDEAVFKQLKRLVREGELRRERFLPGRPSYTIA